MSPQFETAIIVQARMASTRLPGKVLKTVSGKPLLTTLIERLRRAKTVDGIVIATTVNDIDDPIEDLCLELDTPCFRGSEADVLERYFWAAKICNAARIVRVTADCPLIDPHVIDTVVGFAKAHPEFTFVTNTPEDKATRTYPRGMDTEVFSFQSLSEAHHEAKDPAEREHVTVFFKRHPERYKAKLIHYSGDRWESRLTVDTPEDFELIRRILEALIPTNPRFTLEDVFHMLKKNPTWDCLNAHVEQKET